MVVWQPVRKTLVFDSHPDKLRPDVSRVWLTRIQWDHIDDLRQKREGTVIEFLDETETAVTFTGISDNGNIIDYDK